MKHSLLPFLICPISKQPLSLEIKEEQNGEVKEWLLTTEDGAHSYPITNYIPRFVENDGYVESFSLEWTTHKHTQVDAANERKEAEEKFFRHTGLAPTELNNKLVLDVGCGVGRFMEIVNNHGGEIVGIDMSLAVETAFENFGTRKWVHVIQADIFHLPFREDVFDIIYSIGVLHHTPSTKEAFLGLPRFLKKGGEIVISVYTAEWWKAKLGNALSETIRSITKRLDKKRLYVFCTWLAPLVVSAKKKPILSTIVSFLPVRAEYSDEYATLEIFDHLSPWYQDYHTYEEVAGWFKTAQLSKIENLPIPTSVKWRKNEA